MKTLSMIKSLAALVIAAVFMFPSAQAKAESPDFGNDCASAYPVGTTSSTAATISPAGDIDFFRIEPATNGYLVVKSTGTTDTYGYLYSSECSVIAEDDDSGDGSRNFRIRQDISAGTYYIAVRHWRADRTGNYTLSVSFTPDDHGNDCATATPVACGSTMDGNIGRPGDIDYFRIPLTGNTLLRIYTTGSTDTYGNLLNGSCQNITQDNNSGPGSNFLIERTLSPGTYYAAVRHYNASSTGTYSFVTECTVFHNITASAELGGMISPAGTVVVREGESQNFAITPFPGNSIQDVLVDGVSVGAVSNYTFTNVTADHSIVAVFAIPPGACLDIADYPIDARVVAAPANIMFVLDDSGSMDWEVLTPEADGLFQSHSYVFDDPGDHVYKSGTYSQILTGSNRMLWKSQWHGYNRMYYNPSVNYEPWPTLPHADVNNPRSHPTAASPTFDLNNVYYSIDAGIVIDNQDAAFSMTGPWSAATGTQAYNEHYLWTPSDGPYTATWTPNLPLGSYQVYARWQANDYRSTAVTYTVSHTGGTTPVTVNQRLNGGVWNLLGTFTLDPTTGVVSLSFTRSGDTNRVCADAIKYVPTIGPTITINNAHYYVWSQSEGRPYLVVLDGAIKYYEINDRDGDDRVEEGEILPTEAPPADVVASRSYAEERQNFADWYSFYRRRELTATAAIARTIVNLRGVRVGIRSINGYLIQPVLNVMVGETDQSIELLNKLYTLGVVLRAVGTPLRNGLKYGGQYFHKDDGQNGGVGPSPIASAADGGECQQNFAIVMTDGYYNGPDPGFSNIDGDNGPPYADAYSNTLADVAMYYYENDLASGLNNLVPVNEFDSATHQHMVTYSVAFGVYGTLNPADYDMVNGPFPVWPNPTTNYAHKIDDLWHAAVNGRGMFLSASNPTELIDALTSIMQNIEARIGSAASVSINGDELYEKLRDDILMFQGTYYSDGWSGDVKAYRLDPHTGLVNTSTYVWSAADRLSLKGWNERVIATYNGTSGIPFRFENLTNSQKSALDPNWNIDDTMARKILLYLRGDGTNERQNGGDLRTRYRKLGDIVNSAPVFHRNGDHTGLYVGSNDGMLHAFNPDTGDEIFAYAPTFSFDKLAELADPSYSHRFYVDLTPTVRGKVGVGGSEISLLVGGMGKGGMGYFAINVTDVGTITSESDLASRVLWEYPRAATPQSEKDGMGYSYARATIAESYSSSHPWVVIVGNGYESVNGRAMLYILDAGTGTLVKRLDTGAGSCNGLSTPVAIDVDYDYKVDFVYAGDLKGNLWKFDLRDPNPDNWRVSFSESGTPKPLFKATGPGGASQPITSKPDVMLHCSMHGYIVVFGTGMYLGDTSFSSTATQTIYGIWDYSDPDDQSEFLGTFLRGSSPSLSNQPASVSLLQQTQIDYRVVNGIGLRTLSDNQAVWVTEADPQSTELTPKLPNPSSTEANHAGWYFDLPLTGERVISDVQIREGKAIVLAFTPALTPCGSGGDSFVMEMDACSGGRLSKPNFDINNDMLINSEDMINLGTEENPILVAPTGWQKPGRLLPPTILIRGTDEVKYLSSSRGVIEMVREKAARVGLTSWFEIAQ
jgi:type IV pilus assembly protein PilY1